MNAGRGMRDEKDSQMKFLNERSEARVAEERGVLKYPLRRGLASITHFSR